MKTTVPVAFLLEGGARLDRYDLLYEVGRGGMGSVWAALLRGKHGFEKLVAIKTILPEFAGEPRFRALLLNEAHITAKIEHPNVVQTFELGEHQGALYVVMEWVDGEPLDVLQREAARVLGSAIPLGVALRVVADVCAGLHAAHDLRGDDGSPMSIVHSDISPHNILVSARGTTKLADFGLAKIHDRVMALSGEMPSLRGKMHYMAPERASGRGEDRRSDIWSLGVVLQELLPKAPPGACARVLQRALAPAREQRFPTALEFMRAIESAMQDCDLTTTAADVASFFEPILRERSAVRRRKLEQTAAMDATLDVGRDLRPPTDTVPIGASVEETMPMSRTLFIQRLLAAPPPPALQDVPHPRRDRARWRWLGVVVFALGALFAAWLVLVPWLRPARTTKDDQGWPDRGSIDAGAATALEPSTNEASTPASSEPSAKPAPDRKPASAPQRKTGPAGAKSAPAKPDPYDGRY